jgi:hypothetical protein
LAGRWIHVVQGCAGGSNKEDNCSEAAGEQADYPSLLPDHRLPGGQAHLSAQAIERGVGRWRRRQTLRQRFRHQSLRPGQPLQKERKHENNLNL